MSTAPAIPAYLDMHVGPELTVVALPALKLSVSDSETVRIVIEHLLWFHSGGNRTCDPVFCPMFVSFRAIAKVGEIEIPASPTV